MALRESAIDELLEVPMDGALVDVEGLRELRDRPAHRLQRAQNFQARIGGEREQRLLVKIDPHRRFSEGRDRLLEHHCASASLSLSISFMGTSRDRSRSTSGGLRVKAIPVSTPTRVQQP